MVKALKPHGASVFVVFDRSTNDKLKKCIGSSTQPCLSDIKYAVKAWNYSAFYIIKNEVKFQEYSDGSIIFFPNSFIIPSKSPIERPATAT